MAWVRNSPLGGRPYYGRSALAIVCPICDAAIGNKCVLWRTNKGERDYIIHTINRPHAERIRLWKLRNSAAIADEKPPGL